MKIIEVARQQRDLLNEGMAFIAVWGIKQGNGKFSWYTEDFQPIEVNDCDPTFNEEQLARLAKIAEIDENAILLNGYYDSWVGSVDDPLNATQIAEGIKRHYELDDKRIKDYLVGEKDCEDNEIPAYEDLQMTEREEFGLGQERRDPWGEDGMQARDVPDFEEDEYCDQHHLGNYTSEPLPDDLAKMLDEFEATGKPSTLTIELPFTKESKAKDTIRKLIESKSHLIKAALGTNGIDSTSVEFTADGTVKFEWFTIGIDNESLTAWTAFLTALVGFAKKAQRSVAKLSTGLGEATKYEFRNFLVKLGLNSANNKQNRKILLQNLGGSSAFRTAECKERWNERHSRIKKEEQL